MKIKFIFSLVVISMAMLAVGTVAANENMTQINDEINSVQDDSVLMYDGVENTTFDNQNDNYQYTDFSVTVKPNTDSAKKGDVVIWTITINSGGGNLSNTKVNVDFDSKMKYVDSSTDAGYFNSKNGVWNIGDLQDSKSLTVRTKVLYYGSLYVGVFAFAKFMGDMDFYDNDLDKVIVSPPPAGPVTDPKKRQNDHHSSHYLSSEQSRFRTVTKSAENPLVEAKVDMKPAGNPIFLAMLSLVMLLGIRFKNRLS